MTVERATSAYCDFLLRTAALGDFAELVAAVLPCMWSYAEIGGRLAAARAPRLEWMRRFAALAESVLETEMDLHRQFAARWGVTAEQLESERTAPATDAYCDYLLRTASLGDFAELVAALLPCMWSYAEIGRHLASAGLPDHEGYAEWIEMYASDEFGQLADWCRELTDAAANDVAGPGRRRMHAAFRASSEHELAFWESAWRG